MKRVLLVHTGGTLGMTGRRPDALKPGPFFRMVRDRVPELAELARLDFELFSNIDSSEMQPEGWSRLARRLYQALPRYDGCVVTHGTDTMAETAAALSFMLLHPPCPIVLTGAQRPLSEIRSDARLNLIDAVTAALAGPREVTVCFDSHLYRGNRVSKVSAAEYDAFDSPNTPVLGVLGVNTRFIETAGRRGRFTLKDGVDARVFLLRVFPGLDPALARAVLPHVNGVVVAAFGAGNVPTGKHGRSLLGFFEDAQARGIPALVVSQAPRNGVDLSLYAPGVALAERGAISGGDMTVHAAVVKMMHALGSVAPARRRAYLERSVAGERSQG